MLSVAAGIMALHYDTVLDLNGSCLIPFLFGNTETGMCGVILARPTVMYNPKGKSTARVHSVCVSTERGQPPHEDEGDFR